MSQCSDLPRGMALTYQGSTSIIDEVSIRIGKRTNIQDDVIIHGDQGQDVVIGDGVTIGHGAIIHGCKIENSALIGMGAVLLDGVVVESGAFNLL